VPQLGLTTFKDLCDRLYDYAGANPASEAVRNVKRAALDAYRDLALAGPWTYYYQQGRIVTNADQADGTVTYDHTGGTYERMLTLSTGTWPDWAPFGVVQIGTGSYTVAEKKTATVLTLSSHSNPGADVAAGASYRLYRDTYPLPIDFRMGYAHHMQANWGGLHYCHPSEWLAQRELSGSIGTPYAYTVAGDDNYFGALALKLYPPPDDEYTLNFLYQRLPRQLRVDDYSAGTVGLTAGLLTLSGTGTSWSSRHVGCVVRVSLSDTDELPTGPDGLNPYAEERTVLAVDSATSIQVDAAWSQSLSGVRYVLSDPADVEPGVMLNALFRGAEDQLGKQMRLRDRGDTAALYRQALLEAKAADSRVGVMRGVGWESASYRPFRQLPLGSDVSQ
jgi:hypothetical protein